jgi:hypothetical protein
MLSWPAVNIGGHTKRGVAIALIISVSQIGSAVGGQLYRNDDGKTHVFRCTAYFGGNYNIDVQHTLFPLNSTFVQTRPHHQRLLHVCGRHGGAAIEAPALTRE